MSLPQSHFHGILTPILPPSLYHTTTSSKIMNTCTENAAKLLD